MAENGGGWFSGLLGGGGGSSTLDLYGDLFTDAQKAALQREKMTQGFFRMAETLGKLAQPSRAPPGLGGTLGALGAGLGAFGGGTAEETALKGMEVAEKVKQSRQERAILAKAAPLVEAITSRLIAAGVPAAQAAQIATQAAAPAAPAVPATPTPAVPLPPAVPPSGMTTSATAADAAVGAPPAPPPLPAAPQQNTGLLGAPDQLVGPDGQPLPQGVLPNMLASLTGGTPGGGLPFRLASAAIPNGPRGEAAGSDNNLGGLRRPGVIATPSQGGFQTFDTPEAGVAAISKQLDRYASGATTGKPLNTVRSIVSTWAPPHENDTPAMIKRAADILGVGPDTPLDMANPNVKARLVEATIRNERGGALPVDPQMIQQAVATTPGGGGSLPIRQATAALAPYAIDNAVIGGPSSVAGVGDALSSRILDMTKAMPPDVLERFRIISGERTPQRQRDVYRGSGTPPPMNSRHISGDAVDLRRDPIVLDWISRNGPQFGVGFPLVASMGAKEANHLEMVDASGNRVGPQDTVIPTGPRLQRSDLMNVADTGSAAPAGQGGVIPGLGVTPEALAGLNAMLKMGGMKSDPFGSLLETYYKSPGYLGEAATAQERARAGVQLTEGPKIKKAETIAELEAQIDLKPKLERAIELARIDPKLTYDEKKAVIDRESERLKQVMTMMGTSREVVVTPPGGGPRKLTLTNEQILRLNQGKPLPEIGLPAMTAIQLGEPVLSPKETAEQTAAGKAPYESGPMTLEFPDGEVREVDVTGQQRKDIQEGKPVPAIGWPGAGAAAGAAAADSGARVGKTVYPPGHAEATTVLLKERRPKAEAAVQSLNFNDTAQRLLDAGIISGYGASLRLDVAKAKSLLGWDDARIANTEIFLATQARQVAASLAAGAFGSGSSITDADREYAASMAGANSNLDEKSLRFLIRQNATAANWEIDRYNNDVQRHDPKGRLPILRVERPPKAEAQPSANQPKPIGAAKIGDKPYVKWSDGHWRPEGELPGQENR